MSYERLCDGNIGHANNYAMENLSWEQICNRNKSHILWTMNKFTMQSHRTCGSYFHGEIFKHINYPHHLLWQHCRTDKAWRHSKSIWRGIENLILISIVKFLSILWHEKWSVDFDFTCIRRVLFVTCLTNDIFPKDISRIIAIHKYITKRFRIPNLDAISCLHAI
jgi:hypothetical protein